MYSSLFSLLSSLPPPSPSLTHLLTRLVILGSLCCSRSPSLIPFVPYFRSQALFQRLDSKRPILFSLLVLNLCFKSQAKQGLVIPTETRVFQRLLHIQFPHPLLAWDQTSRCPWMTVSRVSKWHLNNPGIKFLTEV